MIKEAAGEYDWDTVDETIDRMLEELPFIIEDSGGIFLSQRDFGEELVDYLEEVCGETPAFFKERLDHVPNSVWFKRGLSPPRT